MLQDHTNRFTAPEAIGTGPNIVPSRGLPNRPRAATKLSIRPWKGFGQRLVSDSRTLAGLGFLLVTAFGWGLNWPATKFLIATCPPLTARGIAGIAAGMGLAAVAAARGEELSVPRGCRVRLVQAAALNVTAWMGLTTVSMLWLRAGQAATLAYTMPVWAALVAWPVLNEPMTRSKILALALGIGGICTLFAGTGFGIGDHQLPGAIIALSAALLFAAGTALSKRWPLEMPPVATTAWQVGLGCLPLLVASFVFERPHLLQMPWFGWLALGYTAAMSLGLCYLTWFAALRRLPAGTAAIGTLLTPIIGVLASALTLGEPLTLPQIGALTLVATSILLTLG